MASRRAAAFLAANGIVLAHTGRERSNFATGRGTGKLASPFHVIATGGHLGTSKRTVGWAKTQAKADDIAGTERLRLRALETGRCKAGGGAEYRSQDDSRQYVYTVDIRTNSQDIDMRRLGFTNR